MRELPGACEAMYRASSYVSRHTIADRAPISYEANLCTEKQTQNIFSKIPKTTDNGWLQDQQVYTAVAMNIGGSHARRLRWLKMIKFAEIYQPFE